MTKWTGQTKVRLNSLIKIGECCKSLGIYSKALIFYRKSLKYAWLLNDTDSEWKIYDRISLVYYQINDLEKSSYYKHLLYIKCNSE